MAATAGENVSPPKGARPFWFFRLLYAALISRGLNCPRALTSQTAAPVQAAARGSFSLSPDLGVVGVAGSWIAIASRIKMGKDTGYEVGEDGIRAGLDVSWDPRRHVG